MGWIGSGHGNLSDTETPMQNRMRSALNILYWLVGVGDTSFYFQGMIPILNYAGKETITVKLCPAKGQMFYWTAKTCFS